MCATHALSVDASSLHVCTDECMASNSQYTLPSWPFPQKKGASGKSQLYSKQSSDGPFPETIGGYFEHLHVSHFGTRLAEEKRRRKKE